MRLREMPKNTKKGQLRLRGAKATENKKGGEDGRKRWSLRRMHTPYIQICVLITVIPDGGEAPLTHHTHGGYKMARQSQRHIPKPPRPRPRQTRVDQIRGTKYSIPNYLLLSPKISSSTSARGVGVRGGMAMDEHLGSLLPLARLLAASAPS
jgi:hypothetical protein